MSVSVDWKPERAVQEKIRDKKNVIILIGWNPKRAIYAKVKDHDKVTASVRHNQLGASSYQKTFDSKRPQTKESEQKAICIICTPSTWGIQLSEDLWFEASADQRLGTGEIQSC